MLVTSGYTGNSILHGGRLDAGFELLSKPYAREALARKIRLVLAPQKARSPEKSELAPLEDEGSGSVTPKPATALIVEDDALIRMAGFSIIEARRAEEAMSILQDHPVDVLVTDVKLPSV